MLHSVQQDTSFGLSKTVYEPFFNFFFHKGILGGPKVTRNQGAKINKKMGCRRYDITFGVLGKLYCTAVYRPHLYSPVL